MKTVHTVMREDFGALDPNVIRTELLAATGIHEVAYRPSRRGLSIDYDPEILTPPKLFELLCRCGVYPDPQDRTADAPEDNES